FDLFSRSSFSKFVELCEETQTNGYFRKSNFGEYTPEVINYYIDNYMETILHYHSRTIIKIVIICLHIDESTILKLIKYPSIVGLCEHYIMFVNMAIVDSHKRNFLFHVVVDNQCSFDNLLSILGSSLKFDVNHKDKYGYTFVLKYLEKHGYGNPDKINVLVDNLRYRKYDFNHISKSGISFFAPIFRYRKIDYLLKILDIPELDITLDPQWIRIVVEEIKTSKGNLNTVKDIFFIILGRKDYTMFLCNLIKRYYSPSAEDDLIEMICGFMIDREKVINMISYIDSDRNTFIHLAAKKHYKRLLSFLDFTEVKIFPNNQGKYPDDLYEESRVKKKLEKMNSSDQ
ncbi:MAG: hypothetical protein QW303_01495, partial [Nitrososphaerota archaeon]